MSNKEIAKCFDANGEILFDPYRNEEDPRYAILFADDNDIYASRGCLKHEVRTALTALINEKKWEWTCDAVALLHADRLGRNTSGYPTIYLFR